MSDPAPHDAPAAIELGEYCRRVEEHLTRVNQGNLVRIAGVAFELVRSWAVEGIPLPIVYRGIEQKAERHRAGRSTRPLRLEFCENDVRALYDDWRRAVGIHAATSGELADAHSPVIEERRRPSVVRQLDRAIGRLLAAAARLETPEALRERLASILEQLSDVRDQLRGARGEARRVLLERAAAIDVEIGEAARQAVDLALPELEAEARRELAGYRARMAPDAWSRSVDAAVDRLLRERFGLPSIDIEAAASES